MADRTKRNALESVQKAAREQVDWYENLDEVGGPYAWYTGGVPIEIFYGMDITPVMPENFQATASARQEMGEYHEAAYSQGWDQDICSYCRGGLGMVSNQLDKEDMVYGGLPDPDILITHRGTCDTQQQWWEEYHRQMDVPLYVIDVPQTGGRDDEHPADIDYYRQQLSDLVRFLERHTDRTAIQEDLWEAIELSDQASELWRKICVSSSHVPAPLTVSDRFKLMGIPALFLGTERAVRLLGNVWAEIEERIEAGIGAAKTEDYRLLWDDIAIWYDLQLLYELEAEGYVFVADTYSDPFGFLWRCHEHPGESMADFEKDDPLEALAKPYVRNLQRQWRVDHRLDYFQDWIEYFKIDGVVFHSNRSCRPYSLSQLLIQQEIEVPNALIDADHTDPQAFSKSQAELRLDAMKEQVRVQNEARRVHS